MTTAVLVKAVRARPAGRVVGVDVARAVAMLGMVTVHYVWPDNSGSAMDVLTTALSGRAMPLFVLLGGLGVSLAATRTAAPAADLLIRAAILMVLGLGLQETSVWIAVILQSYALFFALAPILRRLSNAMLVCSAALVALAGSFTYQTIGTPPQTMTFADLREPSDALLSLLFDGYYPFFPVAGFFLLGMRLGRLDLSSDRVATRFAAVGSVVGVGAVWLVGRLGALLAVDTSLFDDPQGSFTWSRLLDDAGHSQMLAWVVSAGGSSVAVLGFCLLVGRRLGSAASPIVALGTLSLSFYAFQVVLTRVVASPLSTSFGRELVTAATIYFGFMLFAHWWKRRFRSGPLEALLRSASSRRPESASSSPNT